MVEKALRLPVDRHRCQRGESPQVGKGAAEDRVAQRSALRHAARHNPHNERRNRPRLGGKRPGKGVLAVVPEQQREPGSEKSRAGGLGQQCEVCGVQKPGRRGSENFGREKTPQGSPRQ